MKYCENIKFSNEMPYHLVSLLEKVQISSKILNFSEIEEILHKIIDFHENYSFHRKRLKTVSKQTTVHPILLKKYRFYHISLFQQIPRI